MSIEKDNILKKAQDVVVTLFSNVVPADKVESIKKWVSVKLAEETPAPTDLPAAPTNKEVKTKDGKMLSIEGEIKVDAPIKEMTETGMVDLEDGDYVLVDDANVELPIKVAGGKITEVTAPVAEETPAPEAEMAKQVAVLSAQLSEQKTLNEKTVSDLKAEVKDLTTHVVELSNHLVKILETPVNFTAPKTQEELTALDKHRIKKEEYNASK